MSATNPQLAHLPPPRPDPQDPTGFDSHHTATSQTYGPMSATTAPRPYLVFVRAGRESWHQKLIAEDPDRNWDCCVNWYLPTAKESLAEYYLEDDGKSCNKLEGFLRFWGQRPQPWPYRYVLLLDDDIYLRPGDLSWFFTLCDHYGTYLSQPGLRWFTHTTLNALVRNPACLLRRVSFIEAMAPCFSTAALERLMYTFTWTRSVWGVDWAWSCLLEGRHPLYVVDAVPMEHTRSGNGRPTRFYRQLRAMGVDPREDLRRIQQMFPQFQGSRTLSDGHVFRPEMPQAIAPAVMSLFERLKVLVRLRKKCLRMWRSWRAHVQDLVRAPQ